MGDAGSRRKPDRSITASGKTAKNIVKAAAREQTARRKLTDATKTLRATLDAMTQAKSGSSGEKTARRAAHAAIDVLVTAKRKLKKAQKKLKKAAAKQVKATRTAATATAKPKSVPAANRRVPSQVAASGSKSRKFSALPPIAKPDAKTVEDRRVAEAAPGTSSDSLAGSTQGDEAAHVDF